MYLSFVERFSSTNYFMHIYIYIETCPRPCDHLIHYVAVTGRNEH